MITAGGTIAANAHIFGPFEAGFTSQQDNIITNWGCTTPSLVYDTEGGKDIGIAESHVAYTCDIEFPRTVGNTYFGVVGPCGGHTGDYHFHRSFSCLYAASGGHSTKVGVVAGHDMYGKWEDFNNNLLPLLDACGAHIGPTPESSTPVYHYHVQDQAPFTVGCHGPSSSGGLVSLAVCRSLYPNCGSSADIISVTLKTGTVQYARFCPCFDATGSNVGTQELPALSTSDISFTAGSSPSTSESSTTTTSQSTAGSTSTGSTTESSTVSQTDAADSTTPTTTSTTSQSAGSTSTTSQPAGDTSTTSQSTTLQPVGDQSTTAQSTGSTTELEADQSASTSRATVMSGSFLSSKVGWALTAAGCLATAPDPR